MKEAIKKKTIKKKTGVKKKAADLKDRTSKTGEEDSQEASSKLNYKQRLFVEHYVGKARFNASEAARLAGYADPGQSGWKNTKKVEIAEEISRRLAERVMGKDEVLVRLADQARAEYAQFFESNDESNDGGHDSFSLRLNFKKLIEAGYGHLIKKLKTHNGVTEVEFYDSQAALALLARHHKLLTDKTEVSFVVPVSPADAEP